MHITFTDGTHYEGWRALPYVIIFLPFLLPYLLFGVGLFLLRWITRKDNIFGYHYDGHGTWTKID